LNLARALLRRLSQIMVGDKRGTVKFGSCGVTEGLGLTVEARWGALVHSVCCSHAHETDSDLCAWPRARQAAASGVKPHVPPATANRVDNSGNWGAGDHD
jgi:hypothetical protein